MGYKQSEYIETDASVTIENYEFELDYEEFAKYLCMNQEEFEEFNEALKFHEIEMVSTNKNQSIFEKDTPTVQMIYDEIKNSHHWGHIIK